MKMTAIVALLVGILSVELYNSDLALIQKRMVIQQHSMTIDYAAACVYTTDQRLRARIPMQAPYSGPSGILLAVYSCQGLSCHQWAKRKSSAQSFFRY